MSACGSFWLKVQEGVVSGKIERATLNDADERMPLETFRSRVATKLSAVRNEESFYGEVKGGEGFEKQFGGRFVFHLEPTPVGWRISITENGRAEDLSRLTPPMHFLPNPREIEGLELRNSNNTGLNEFGEKNFNAPQLRREFIFSPEIGRSIGVPGQKVSDRDIIAIRRFGWGELQIIDYELTFLEEGRQAATGVLKFYVRISWRAK